MSDHSTMLHAGYNATFVVLSYCLAVLGSFTALLSAATLPRALGILRKTRSLFEVALALALGGGIWAMHFIAMLACEMGIEVTYDTRYTFASLLIVVVACALGTQVAVSGKRNDLVRLIGGGAIVGLGATLMHYVGMAAMRMPAQIHYGPASVIGTMAIGVFAGCVALWLAVNLTRWWTKLGAALVMGVAECALHYTAMSGTHFVPAPAANGIGGLGGFGLAVLVFIISFCSLLFLLFISSVRRIYFPEQFAH